MMTPPVTMDGFRLISYDNYLFSLWTAEILRSLLSACLLKSRPCENSLADSCTSEVNPLKAQKADGQAFRIAKVR